MKTVTVSELRANCSALLNSVRDTKQPIRKVHFGRLLAEIHPLPISAAEKERLQAEREAREIEIIHQNADQLNAGAMEGLSYGASSSNKHGPKRSNNKKKDRKQR